ncbi:dienelactone hydrolase family protein [Halomicroarcula sp. F13]|uniref:Dienelactone hydrolase family protein n=1 Tax=Haloarcula rubra TaxID=2487747 RepID=A0AAW4PNC5_9EURY|nr:dienelactone hydrolase family protein [Halomicroarcula rubra]MBX0322095.1 dienelactone hydrolase family protein [Halomicroarcula rubra]
MSDAEPHAGQEIVTSGAPPQAAEAAVIMLHGRGDSARHFLRLADEFHHHGAMYLAPEAAGKAWFPGPADAPDERRAPWLTSAFSLVERTLDRAAAAGVAPERTVFVGFSQGASVAGAYVAADPARYGGLAMLAGGLLGPDPVAAADSGSLEGTPVFVGCGDEDPYISPDRVRATAAAFRALDADVTERVYEGVGHAVNDDEIAAVDALVAAVADGSA